MTRKGKGNDYCKNFLSRTSVILRIMSPQLSMHHEQLIVMVLNLGDHILYASFLLQYFR